MGATARFGRRRQRMLVFALLVTVALLAAITAGGLYWKQTRDDDVTPVGVPARPGPADPSRAIEPLSPDAPAPTADGVATQLAPALRNSDLGELTGQISDPLTGEVLWSQDAGDPRIPASNAKILTAAAALLELPHDQRITTRVVDGGDGQVILVGAGDPTLSAEAPGDPTFYTDPARISDLAGQIRDRGLDVRSVAVDTTAFPGPDLAPSWDRGDIAGGNITPISALITDGGRLDPLDENSPRTPDPAQAAGQALADALGVTAPVEAAAAPAGAATVASVESAPLVTRVGDMMRFSDNVLAETIAIELSQAKGGPATIAGGTDAIISGLREAGFDTDGVVLRDASGLSDENRVPAATLDEVMSAAAGDDHLALRPMLDALPIAAGTGTLAGRFDPARNPGAGWVRAKTGTLTEVTSLTGIVQTVDGRVLAFSLMSGGTAPDRARPAIDALAGRLRECGCRG